MNTPSLNVSVHDTLVANYVLVELTVNDWAGEKTDKDATRRAEINEGAIAGAASLKKKLLAGNNAKHKHARSLQVAVRSYLYSVSMPWTSTESGAQKKGARLVLASRLMEVMATIDKMIALAAQGVEAFLAEYEQARDASMQALGGLAVMSDYPDPQEIKARFGVEVKYKPVPALADYSRITLPADVATALADKLVAENTTAMQAAQADAQERLLGELDRMTNQLTKVVNGDKTKIFESLVTNMRAVTDVVEASNFSGAPNIAEAVEAIRTKLVPKYRDRDDFKDPSLARIALAELQQIRGVIVAPSPALEPVVARDPAEFVWPPIVEAQKPEAVTGEIDGISADNNCW